MPDYRPSLFERVALDDPAVLRALGWSLPFSAALGGLGFVGMLGHGFVVAIVVGGLAFGLGVLVVGGAALVLIDATARAGAWLLLPSGNSTPGEEELSRERALVAAGRVDEALRVLERRRAEEPGNVALVLFTAELWAREGGDPRRAAHFFRAAREMRGVPPERDLYATNRLIDLYLGPLDDRAAAVRELHRLRERHPGSREAAAVGRVLEGL
jgi:hypothetical protein